MKQKDPAFLFYSKDFISETQFLTMDERGKLMYFRANLHQHGRLSADEVEQIIGSLSERLKGMLKVDSKGNYYCPVTEQAIKDRENYILNQIAKGKYGWEVKKLMKEKDWTAKQAREYLSEKENIEESNEVDIKSNGRSDEDIEYWATHDIPDVPFLPDDL